MRDIALGQYKIVEILWDDTRTIGGEWTEDLTDEKTMPTLTVGYIIQETNEFVKVVMTMNETHMGDGHVIPKGAIRKMVKL